MIGLLKCAMERRADEPTSFVMAAHLFYLPTRITVSCRRQEY